MRAIIRVGNKLSDKSRNPHYRIYSYGVVQAGTEQFVVLFGYTPTVRENEPWIVEDENRLCLSYKTVIGEEIIADYITTFEPLNDQTLENNFSILYDKANEIIKQYVAQKNESN